MKNVVITGADNGIGFYITKTLLEDGYRGMPTFVFHVERLLL